MYRSRTFLSQCRRVSPDEVRPEAGPSPLEDLFLRNLPPLPSGLGAELFVHVAESQDPVEEIPQRLADMVDLFWMQYDDEADPLSREDWSVLRDLIDEHAQELELSLVQYVMERVVSHKAL